MTGVRQVRHHQHGLGVDGLSHHLAVVCDVLHHLVKSRPLDLLVLQVAERIADKVKEDTALTELLDEQLLSVHQRGVFKGRKLLQLTVPGEAEA